jgi:hypothetical protein
MNELTEIVCIVDRSGSMEAIKKEAIGGFNNFLESQQKVEGKANMTLAQFDDQYELLYNGVDVQNVSKYTDATYVPRGMTALLDAVGKTINSISARMAAMKDEDRAKKVLVSILTDGYENASKEYKLDQVKKLVEEKRAVGWEFIFIGAGLDKIAAESIGTGMGVNASNILNVNHSGTAQKAMYSGLSEACTSYRCSDDIGVSWKATARKYG